MRLRVMRTHVRKKIFVVAVFSFFLKSIFYTAFISSILGGLIFRWGFYSLIGCFASYGFVCDTGRTFTSVFRFAPVVCVVVIRLVFVKLLNLKIFFYSLGEHSSPRVNFFLTYSFFYLVVSEKPLNGFSVSRLLYLQTIPLYILFL